MGQFQDVISFQYQIVFSTATAHTHKTMSTFCTTYLTRNTLKGIQFSMYSWHLQSKRGKEKKKWLVVYLAPSHIQNYLFFILHNMIIINHLKKNVCIQKKLFTDPKKKKKKKIYRIVSRHNSF